MPAITPQTPPRKAAARPPAKPGSMLSQAVPVGEVSDDFIKMVIYGVNRVGKTTLACQWPKPLLLVACEPNLTGGSKSVANIPEVTYIRIAKTIELDALCKELRVDSFFRTVVLDTATSLQDVALQEIMERDSTIEQLNFGEVPEDAYRKRSEVCKERLRPLLNLKKHTVIIAQEKDHRKQQERTSKLLRGFQPESMFASDLGGATAQWLHDACDYICQLYLARETKEVTSLPGTKMESKEQVETGRYVRRLRTMLHPNYVAGFRSPRPELIPEYLESPTFAKIEALIKGQKVPA